MTETTTKQKKAVIYCRVSTKEQVEEGNSLVTQEKMCYDYAAKNGYLVVEKYIEEGESAKTTERPELQNMLQYCHDKKNGIHAIIAYKLDRISRNMDDYSQIRILLKRYGVEIKSTSENFENTPVGRFMENTMANIAQFDNDIRTERCVGGMKQAVAEGRYVWMAPIGYDNVVIADKCTIAPNSKMGPLMHRAFQLTATGLYQTEEILKIVTQEGLTNKKGRPISDSNFHVALRNELYAGIVIKFGETVTGTFEPIVTKELFQQAQRVLSRKGWGKTQYISDHPDFPLRRFVTSTAGKPLTGYWSGRKSKRHAYYGFAGRGKLFRRDQLESAVMEFMDKYSFTESHYQKLLSFVRNEITRKSAGHIAETKQLEKHIEELKERQTVLIKKNIANIISDSVLSQQLDLIEKEIFEANNILAKTPTEEINMEMAVAYIKQYLKNPSEVWRKAKIETQLRLQLFEFPSGVVFDGMNCRTPEVSIYFKGKEGFLNQKFDGVHSVNELSNKSGSTSLAQEADRHSLLGDETEKLLFIEKLKQETIRLLEILKGSDTYS